jgi:hypothetical protein
LKARLLFPGTAFAVGLIAFAVGYRIPRLLQAIPTKLEQAPAVAHVSANQAPVAGTPSALSRDNLQVEGFAKIGFAEMEELLTTASAEQRERWAQELGALPDSPLKPIALIAFYTSWLDLKPDEAIRALPKFPDLMYRLNVFDVLRSAIPTTLLPQVIEVISGLSETERHVLLPSYLTTLAETDPAATARFIDSHPNLVKSSDAAALMSAWARDDIAAARKWLEAGPFFTAPVALRALVDSWYAKDPAAAQDYVVLQKDNEGIDEAINSVAVHLFETSPERTREFIGKFDDERAAGILTNLVSSVKNDQVANLTTWASTLPSSVNEKSLGYALGRWSSVDLKQTLDWIQTKPATERESLVVQMIGSQMAPAAPDVVLLAFKIRDAQKREAALTTLVQSLAADTGDATEQIRALGLSVSQTNHLLELQPKSEE